MHSVTKSHELTKVIYLIPAIESFEQPFFILKGFLQLYRLKKHKVAIGIYQLLSNSKMYEHICLENINKLYTSAVKFYYQLQYKDIIEAEMVSNPGRFNSNRPMSSRPSVTVRKSSARKLICLFTEVLDEKKKNIFRTSLTQRSEER